MARASAHPGANALTPAVPAPTGLRAGTTSAGVSLDWDDPQDATITGYKILRRLGAENSQGAFGVLVEDTGTAATAYLDDTAAGKVRYYYQVQAIRTSGLSAASDSVTVFTRLRPLTVTSLGLLFEAELTVADSNDPSRPSLGLARFGGFGQLAFTNDPQDLRAHFVTTLAYLTETDRQLVLVVHRPNSSAVSALGRGSRLRLDRGRPAPGQRLGLRLERTVPGLVAGRPIGRPAGNHRARRRARTALGRPQPGLARTRRRASVDPVRIRRASLPGRAGSRRQPGHAAPRSGSEWRLRG